MGCIVAIWRSEEELRTPADAHRSYHRAVTAVSSIEERGELAAVVRALREQGDDRPHPGARPEPFAIDFRGRALVVEVDWDHVARLCPLLERECTAHRFVLFLPDADILSAPELRTLIDWRHVQANGFSEIAKMFAAMHGGASLFDALRQEPESRPMDRSDSSQQDDEAVTFDLFVWRNSENADIGEAEKICVKALRREITLTENDEVIFFDQELRLRFGSVKSEPPFEIETRDGFSWVGVPWRLADELATAVHELASKYNLWVYDPQHRSLVAPGGFPQRAG